MKKFFLLFTMFVTLLWVTQSCNDEQQRVATPRDVSFSLGLLRGGDASGRATAEIPDGAAVLITVTKADGTPVLTQARINILRMGEGLVTAPIRLEPGNYKVTDFWVVQDSSEILFLIPKIESQLGHYVSKPVPFVFSVDANGVTNISVQVISAQNHDPEDFGYVSFDLSVVDAPALKSFRIAVFVRSGSGLVLTDATAFLIGSMDYNQTITLEAKINTVAHDNIFGRGFELYIHKPGYVSYVSPMALPENAPQYKDIPLEVILEEAMPLDSPSISFYGHWMFPGAPVDLSFEGAGTVFIDWGDGYTEKETFDGGRLVKNYYAIKPWRTISVRNDLDKIIAIEAGTGVSYPDGMQAIDIREAVNLKSLKLMDVKLDYLDLSYQTKLETLIIQGVSTETPTILPAEHNLRDVRFSYWDDNYHALVDNIYANTVAKNIRNGYFWHSRVVPHETLPQDVVYKLEALRTIYGWEVYYNQ
ncbi:hypothetical protein KK062_24625 [Fulvivirgaceae bacterium PWU5]|uniref:Uncharacterized protein n=1 Tax=Dawidia cretensis TaxID=2782350 RepID=A0AAP2E1V9_9BACT|nr:hypothetical protein [Dawidia cretensis]MBT1711451.1 hypothetical protein [Dawidia cretensis]